MKAKRKKTLSTTSAFAILDERGRKVVVRNCRYLVITLPAVSQELARKRARKKIQLDPSLTYRLDMCNNKVFTAFQKGVNSDHTSVVIRWTIIPALTTVYSPTLTPAAEDELNTYFLVDVGLKIGLM